MKYAKSLLTVIAVLAMAFVSCKKEEEVVTPRSVALDRQELTLVIGAEQSLSAAVEPEKCCRQKPLLEKFRPRCGFRQR